MIAILHAEGSEQVVFEFSNVFMEQTFSPPACTDAMIRFVYSKRNLYDKDMKLHIYLGRTFKII
ncbi:hypothetical protein JCM10914A_07230 [Paenibacillus sp. JCM 10914]